MKPQHLAWLVSFLTGFSSLALEIIWLRVLSYSEGNSPRVLSLVLGLYFLGIAIGAYLGRRLTGDGVVDAIRRRAALMLGASAGVDGLTPFLLTWSGQSVWTMPLMALLILFSSSTKASMFPVVHHLGSKPGKGDTGRSLSKVYFFNIIGSTLGPLLVGFWALDWVSSQQLILSFGLLIYLTAIFMWPAPLRILGIAWIPVIPMVAGLMFTHPHHMMKALAYASDPSQITWFSENKYGLIHTVHNAELGDAIFGGNLYDGRLNIDPMLNSNRIDRLLLLCGLHPRARRILVIGLSGGSWVRVLMEFPGVEQIDVIEINPAYLSLIEQTPKMAYLQRDPRVHIHIDDGRRWLKRHKGEPFDLVIMNTTFHWRAYISNLLSSEFLAIVRSHLAQGGLLAFNSTDEPDTLYTASKVFTHAYRRERSNFIYAGDWNFSMHRPDEAVISSMLIRLTESEYTHEKRQTTMRAIVDARWISPSEQERITGRPLEVITDQNMLTEFRYGRH